MGIAIFQRKPLTAEGIDFAGLWRVGGDESSLWKERRQQGDETEKIAAIGAIAMQQNDQLLRLAAGRRFTARSIEISHE